MTKKTSSHATNDTRYRTIIENIADGYYEVDIAGNLTFFNDAVCEILGYPRSKLMGMNFRDYTDERNAQRVFQAYNQVYNTGTPAKVIGWEITTQDAEKRRVEVSVSLMRDSGDDPIGFHGIVRDVAELEQAKEALKASEAKYQELIEHANSIILRLDTQGRITFFNEFAQSFFGYTEDEILGQKAVGTIVPEQEGSGRDLATMIHDIALNPERYVNNENENTRRDGQRVWVAWTNKVILDDKGRLTEILCIGNDISHRVRAEEALREAHEDLERRVAARTAELAEANTRLEQEIVERARAEEALREREEFVTAIVENIPHMIFVKDAKDLRFVRFNRGGEELLGFSRDDLIGKNDYDFFPKEEADFFTEKDREVLRNREVEDIPEESIQTRFKGERILHTKKLPICDAQGKPQYLLGISEDITERVRAEEALRESEAKYRELVENANSIIFRMDTQGRVTFFNEYAQSFFGYTEEEILGRSTVGTFVPEKETTGRDLAAMIADIVKHPERYETNENENMRRNGERVWVAWTNKAILDDQGRLNEILCIGNDITERKRAEQTLREQEGFLATILENIPHMIFVKDAKDLRFVRFNRGGEELLGFSRDDLIGKNDYDFFPKEEADFFTEKDREVLRNREVEDIPEESIQTRFKGERILHTKKLPICDAQGTPQYLLGISEDITERVQAETDLERRTAQLQTAAEVSQAATGTLNPDELVQQVVDLACQRFDLYYAGLFLVDQSGEWTGQPGRWAVLRAGSGEAGRQMLEAGHKLEVGGESMIGWCVANKQARIALDVGEEAVRFENPWLPETRSEMALPLVSRGQAIGAMTIQSTREAAFSDEDIAVLQTMADQLANAIQNARLFETQAQRTEELATLNQIAATVSRSLEMQDLLEAALENVVTALGYDAGLISLHDEATGHLHLASQQGLPAPMLKSLEQKGLANTLCDLVFQTVETIGIADVREGAPVDVTGLITHGLHGYVGTPLAYHDRSLGTICLFSRSASDVSPAHISLLEAIGRQIAVGIENARLLAETQRALQEARSAHQRYLRQEWETFLATRRDEESIGYVLTQDGLRPTSQVSSPEIQLAMQNHQPVVVTDREETSPPGQNGDSDGNVTDLAIKARSALAAPISLRGQVIGALDIFDPEQAHEWTDDDLAIVDAVTSQVALAVENARLFEQTQAALAQTEALYRASRRIVSSTNLSTLYQILVDEMARRVEVDQCRLVIFDPQKGYGEVKAEYRPSPNAETLHIPMKGNPSYEILCDTQEPITVEDVKTHPATAQVRDMFAELGIESILIVPIIVRSEVIGSVGLDVIGKRRVFTEAEKDYCQTLASQAAITIDNMRAFEEQKQTAERLREMDRFKTQFLANMSHELRTPLNSIIGFSRVILKGIDGPLTELQKTDLTAIFNSGQHLLGLINDILDLSKIEAGKMELNFEEVSLVPILKGVMSTAVGLVKDRPIRLEHHVPEDLPSIWADSTRLRQILLNLVSNAAKFTEEGKIALSASHDDKWVTISVSDTGIGIAQEKLASIFEEFTQIDGSTTRRFGGTGLGLPISRHFVEMHGGKITVESGEGAGSTFTVTLPINAKTESEMEPVEAPSEAEAPVDERRLVLAVDDDPGVISLYRRYLEGEGYQVLGITNSEEVLDKVIELQPFAITLDVLMPNKDGWQLLRELKECPQTQEIPIVICSIVSEEGLGFSLGAADYLVKPIMEEELLAALSRLDQQQEEVEVVVIDDQADDILLIRRMLEAQDRYRVFGANGGQAGIDLVQRRRPDIIILDLMMPEVDGFAVLEALKGEPDTRNIPVVVITAKELTEEESQQLMGQVEVLLRKGLFTEHELLEDLGAALSRIESRQPANAEPTQ